MSTCARPGDPAGSPESQPPVRWRLSGLIPENLVSQAIWRAQPVTDPHATQRRAALLVWFGLRGPAPTIADVQSLTGLAASTVQHHAHTAALMISEHMQPLTPAQVEMLSKPIEPREDQRARERHARLFALPKPPVAPVSWGRRRQALAGLAVRCVAALGPSTTVQVTAAITESRWRRKQHQDDTYDDLLYALKHDGRLVLGPDTDRWSLTTSQPEFSRDGEVVAALRAFGATFGFGQYRTAMVELGFSRFYVVPFVVHVAGRGRFALADQIGPRRPHRPAHQN